MFSKKNVKEKTVDIVFFCFKYIFLGNRVLISMETGV
jgi:hypothetical protein